MVCCVGSSDQNNILKIFFFFLFSTDDGIADELLVSSVDTLYQGQGHNADKTQLCHVNVTDAGNTAPANLLGVLPTTADDNGMNVTDVSLSEALPDPASVSDPLNDYIKSKRNKNTIKKTEQCIKRFQEWMSGPPRLETRALNDISPAQMDRYIGGWLMEIKKPDGSDYEPDSLTSMHRSINRKLEEIGYGYNIVESSVFKTSKKVLEARRRELKQGGRGNRPNRAEPLTAEQEEKLWSSGQMGLGSADALINMLWYLFTKLLGFRGCHESRQIQWGDIALGRDQNNREYLEFNERETKTRSGNSTHLRPFQPKVFPNEGQPSRCPVAAYNLYSSQRPQTMLSPNSPFFLGVNRNRKPESPWFKAQPMGPDKLSSMMSRMAKSAGLTGRITNHSVRKSMCTQLLHAGIPPTTIMQLSGHKNVQSVNNYAVASTDQQKAMCDILQHNPQPASTCRPFDPLNAAVIPAVSQEPSTHHIMVNPSAQSTHNVLSNIFTGAVFNGPVNININAPN